MKTLHIERVSKDNKVDFRLDIPTMLYGFKILDW